MTGGRGMGSGFVLWLTGLSAAGKSTLARGVASAVARRGMAVEVLDGDELRRAFSPELGFTRMERDRQVTRLAFLGDMLVRNGVNVIVAAIAPYWRERALARTFVGAHRFVEAFVDCPLEVCMTRDEEGLYRRALAGELRGFTGVDDPYEPPLDPAIVLHTDRERPAESVERVVRLLEEQGWIPTPAARLTA